MKKFLIVVLVATLAFVGCGKEAALETQEKVLESQEGIEDVEVNKDQTEITTVDGTTVTVANDMDESVPIPDNYPENILPVFKKANVFAASENDDGSFMVMAATDENYDELVEFYKKVLENAEVTMEQNSPDTYLNMGNLQGFGYTVTISKSVDDSLGYENSFTLIIMEEIDMGMPTDSESETEENNDDVSEDSEMAPAELVIPESITWPEDYPEDIVPAYDQAYTEVKLAMAQGDESMVGLMTEDDKDKVFKYYEGLLGGAADYTTMELQGTTMVAGTIDGLMITVMIVENDGSYGEDERFKTLIQIIY